jgi:hypothetical protein
VPTNSQVHSAQCHPPVGWAEATTAPFRPVSGICATVNGTRERYRASGPFKDRRRPPHLRAPAAPWRPVSPVSVPARTEDVFRKLPAETTSGAIATSRVTPYIRRWRDYGPFPPSHRACAPKAGRPNRARDHGASGDGVNGASGDGVNGAGGDGVNGAGGDGVNGAGGDGVNGASGDG